MYGLTVLLIFNSIFMVVTLKCVHSILYTFYVARIYGESGISGFVNHLISLSPRMMKVVRKVFVYSNDLDKTHLSLEDKWVFHILLSVFIPIVCVIGFFKYEGSRHMFLFFLTGSYVVRQVLLKSFKKKRSLMFNKNAYRLYKFLHNQLSAGVHPNRCMTNLYRIVKDTFLRERLKAFGSMYVQTLDFSLAFEEISNYYDGIDVDAFRIAMEQGLMMGDNLKTLQKQEALMFSKYMNYLQLETNRQKLRTLIVITIFCGIIIFMIGLPLMIELEQALNIIFV